MKDEINKKLINTKALIAILFTVALIIFSEQAFEAAVQGLHTWWEIVFPALLPFFIMSEILMGLGVVHFMGALLEPLMKPVFKVPGVGAFAMAMGLASGYPIGAKITGNLRRERLCTQAEGERLLSFTNTADPLFMIGAVAVGMFGNAALGATLALAHYISCLIVGLGLRFYNPKVNNQDKVTDSNPNTNIFTKAFNDLYQARRRDNRGLGELIGDSIKESINTLLLIGGYIILFSVLTEVITLVGITNLVTIVITFILDPLNLDQSLVLPMVSGLFEITNGSHLASQSIAPLNQQIIVASGIIAWSGLSVHAQVASMIKGTDLRMKPYIIARVFHGVLASLITFLTFKPLESTLSTLITPITDSPESFNYVISYWDHISKMWIGFLLIVGFLTATSLTIYFSQKIKFIGFHHSK
ncbi:sporulation integral membrane protein YlbJ [Halonatronum saccharophilum]|uniref:sporulation integral membrane protein YlbJ n=1 Tax=Halonatronum saccharophilum TaxID=150060 RepID=UPI0004AFBC12|nr:sporulation integral membrane protein YlbJ [Halonatronum saccharophilum]